MPNRIIKESARTSPTLDALSHGAERLWWRLVPTADDYGRFDADPRVVLGTCFPLRVGNSRGITLGRVEAWLQELATDHGDGPGVCLYEVAGRRYGVLLKWFNHQRRRDSKPKFPEPPRVAASRGEVPPVAASSRESVVVVSRETRVESRGVPNGESPSGQVKFIGDAFITSEELVLAWRAAYPAIDVTRELRAAASWAVANPKNRKSNWQRFLVNWLARAQDRARPAKLSPREMAAQIEGWVKPDASRNAGQGHDDVRPDIRKAIQSGTSANLERRPG